MLVRSEMMRLTDRSDVGERRSFDWTAMSTAAHRPSISILRVLYGMVGIALSYGFTKLPITDLIGGSRMM